MKVLDFKTINEMHIDPVDFYKWCDEVWQIKEECILPTTRFWIEP